MNAKKLFIFLFLLLSPFDLLIFIMCELTLHILNNEREKLLSSIKQARGMEI